MKKLRYAISLMLSLLAMNSVYAVDENTYTEDKLAVMVQSKQPTFTIKLKSNPSTGYSWFLRGYDAKLITPVKHQYEAAKDRKLIGAPGFEKWVFSVKPAGFIVPQQTIIRFTYARPWDVNEQSTQVVFRVSTSR